jgi:hypothetical protein
MELNGSDDYHIRSKFRKFYLIRTGFTSRESVSLVKVFRLFRLEWIFLGVQSVDTVGWCTTSYLLAGPIVFVMPCCVCVCVCDSPPITNSYIIISWLELQSKVQKIRHTWQICQASHEDPGQAKPQELGASQATHDETLAGSTWQNLLGSACSLG